MNTFVFVLFYGAFAEQVISGFGYEMHISFQSGSGYSLVGSLASVMHHETTAYDCFSWYRKTVSFDDHICITTAYYNDIFAHGYFISFKIE